jgi:hypothetical protein
MTADLVFQLASFTAMAGWLILATGVVLNRPSLREVIAGQLWPFGFATLYTVLIGAFFFNAKGGFDSLANVQLLFTSPWVALAGWVHYLAFDLFIGAMIAREVMIRGIPRLALIVLLPLTFLFGPIGYLTFIVLRTGLAKREIAA